MVAWGSSLDSTVAEVVALFEKMEALFSFMSGLVAVLAPLEKMGGESGPPSLIAQLCQKMCENEKMEGPEGYRMTQ